MVYNKAREEKKWRLWKEAEEKQLRSLGVNEDDIEKLRVHDWAIFNSDRRYYQRVQETGTYLEKAAAATAHHKGIFFSAGLCVLTQALLASFLRK